MRLSRRLAVLLAGGLLGTACRHDARGPEPGMELYAVAPDSVREVLLSSGDRKLYAFRWRAAEPFRLIVATRGDSVVQRCTAGPGFTRWLAAVSRLPIRDSLPRAKDRDAGEWADLELRDASALEPIAARLRLPAAASDPVVVRVDDRDYAVDVDASVLRDARAGCAALGGGRAP